MRLCHAGQNVLIVHNCLFNQNIPLGAELSPSSPCCLAGSLSWHRGGNGQQRRFLKTVQLSKWQWHFHNASLGSSLSAPLSPDTVSLAISSPPIRPAALGRKGDTALSPNAHMTNKQAAGYKSPMLFPPQLIYSNTKDETWSHVAS